MTPHQKRWHQCMRRPHSGNLRRCSCVHRVSIYGAYLNMLGERGVCGLECCLEPKLQGMTSQCGGIGLISCQTYRSVRYRVDVVLILRRCPVPVSMSYGYWYRLRYIRAYRRYRYRYRAELTEVSGTDTDVVPKCPVPVRKSVPPPQVPVLMSYRTYRSFRYRY